MKKSTMSRDRPKLVAIAMSLALGAVTFGAQPASAEPNPPGCPKGYFCVYDGTEQRGHLILRTAGDWEGRRVGAISFFNNGYAYPGADHVDVTYREPFTDRWTTKCLHYNPGDGHKMDLRMGTTVTKVEWRGEC